MFRWLVLLSDRLRQRLESRRLPAHLALGRRAEDLAHRYLQRQGFRVLERNWTPSSGNGEVDLIALDGDSVVFVEVKARLHDGIADPERNVDQIKERALRRCAREYCRRIESARIRFDLVTVVFRPAPEIRHLAGYITLQPPGGFRTSA